MSLIHLFLFHCPSRVHNLVSRDGLAIAVDDVFVVVRATEHRVVKFRRANERRVSASHSELLAKQHTCNKDGAQRCAATVLMRLTNVISKVKALAIVACTGKAVVKAVLRNAGSASRVGAVEENFLVGVAAVLLSNDLFHLVVKKLRLEIADLKGERERVIVCFFLSSSSSYPMDVLHCTNGVEFLFKFLVFQRVAWERNKQC